MVRSDVALTREALEPLIVIPVGEPLDPDRLRRTLRNLTVAGLAAEAQAWTEPTAKGVDLVLVLRPEARVTSVEVAGELPLRAERLLLETPQKAGQPLREDRVVRGVYELEELLESEGYLDAQVRLEVAVDEVARTAAIVYRIDPGVRTLVGRIEIRGLDGRVPESEALEALRARPGKPYRPSLARDDADRLLGEIYAHGFRAATLRPAVETRRGNEVDLLWEVTLGPRVELTITGGDERELAKQDLLPLQGDAGYDEALLLQAVAEIRSYYQERGHYRAAVRHVETEVQVEGVRRVVIEIEPGPRYELAEVRFEAETLSFPVERLERLVSSTGRRLLALGSGRLVDSILAEDLSNLRSFYALEGFSGSRIGPARIDEEGSRLHVVIPIVEGTRRRIVGVRLAGTSAVPESELLESFPIQAGSPFHPFHVDAGAERLRSLLDARGYRSAIVVPEIAWDASGSEANVLYRILEGERSSVDTVVVRGNSRTRALLVERFLGFETGEPISLEGLLEAQRSLYGLAAFSRVEVRAPVYEGEFAAHEVVVEVDEGRTRAVLLGAGYDSEAGARGLVRLSENNFLGRLTTLQVEALVAQREQDYRLIARQPYLARWPIDVRSVLFLEQEDRPSFDVRRSGVSLGVSRAFEPLRIGLIGNYRLVEEELEQPDADVPRESQDARVASLTPTLLYDRRDDPIDPTRGWSAAVDVERAVPFLDADADFTKLFAQATVALPIGRLGTLAASARGGLIFPRAPSDAAADSAAIDAVPVSELFYAGGRTTHRAYRRDELGILGESLVVDDDGEPFPLGGGGLALVNLDWRFPIAGAFGGVVFVDGGNVWREYDDFDPADARWGAGVGLRYRSPLGPLRAEIGWKLDRDSFEDPFVVSVSLGNAF